MAFDINVIKEVYRQMPGRIVKARQLVGRPLTLSEKILYSHLWDDNSSKAFVRGKFRIKKFGNKLPMVFAILAQNTE